MSKIDPAYPPAPQPAQPAPFGYQPPLPGYQPAPAGYGPTGSTSTIVVQQPGLYGPQPGQVCRYREVPCLIVCQYCNATVTTTTHYSVGTLTWVAAAVLLFFGLWLGCCLIPFCLDACKDVVHTCPNCHQHVGRYTRM